MRRPRCGTRRCTMRQQSGVAPLSAGSSLPLYLLPPPLLFFRLFFSVPRFLSLLFSFGAPWNTLLNGTNSVEGADNGRLSLSLSLALSNFAVSQREAWVISRVYVGIRDCWRKPDDGWMTRNTYFVMEGTVGHLGRTWGTWRFEKSWNQSFHNFWYSAQCNCHIQLCSTSENCCQVIFTGAALATETVD